MRDRAWTYAARAPAALSCAMLLLGACASPEAPDAGRAVLSVTLEPASVRAARCTECGVGSTELSATTSVVLRESGGVGASVQSVGVVLRSDGGVTVAQGAFDGAAVAALAGSSRVEARGALTLRAVGVRFPPSPGALPATLTYTLALVDDSGNPHTLTAALRVLP